MPATSTDEELADLGYNEVIKAMAAGALPDFRTWRPESLQRFKDAVVDGELDKKWFEAFSDRVGNRYRWSVRIEDSKDYASYRKDPDEPFVVIGLRRENGGTAAFILQPESDILKMVPAFNTAF
jgi:hypothetical protein